MVKALDEHRSPPHIIINAQKGRDDLRHCRISDVQSWLLEKIKAGIHVARRVDLIEPNFGTKLAQHKNAATPTF